MLCDRCNRPIKGKDPRKAAWLKNVRPDLPALHWRCWRQMLAWARMPGANGEVV